MTPAVIEALHDQIRRWSPIESGRRVADRRLRLRLLWPAARILPGLLVIGVQRGGTSSLFTYLSRHPDVARALRKEVAFFTRHYAAGPDWYRAHFPLAKRQRLREGLGRRPLLGFEATPDYLLDPRAARRAAGLIPDARVIVLLRDPVERAWSHWCHNRRLGQEELSFEEALRVEPVRLGSTLEELGTVDALDPAVDLPLPKEVMRYSYLTRGRYVEQLGRWLEAFPPARVLVVRSEDFYGETSRVFASILHFLGLRPWSPSSFHNYSYVRQGAEPEGPGYRLDPELRCGLYVLFQDANDRLYRLIGRDMEWGTGR